MKVENTNFTGVIIFEPETFNDERGMFYESWQQIRYQNAGISTTFVQDNYSLSKHKVIRGLHYQRQQQLGQLVYVIHGKIFDVGVDLRNNSPTFAQWLSFELDAAKPKQVYWPPGFAHGFCVLSESAIVSYKCTQYYEPGDEGGLLWNDLPIAWPIKDPILSKKDQNFATLTEIVATGKLPKIDLK